MVDVPSGRIVASGLSMPHSPRWYRGRFWLLNSGAGMLGSVAPEGGTFEPLTFCPGYLRGLAFCGDYAVVGLSRTRQDKTFVTEVSNQTAHRIELLAVASAQDQSFRDFDVRCSDSLTVGKRNKLVIGMDKRMLDLLLWGRDHGMGEALPELHRH